jgi:TolA-binding protein
MHADSRGGGFLMRRFALSLSLALVATTFLIGQETARARVDRGIASFQSEQYRQALDDFGSVLADPAAIAERPEALYWTALASIATGDTAGGEKAISGFLIAYPSNPRVPDLLYQKGRLLYGKGDLQGALGSFATFMTAAPGHDLYASALYWSGECLYSLGRLTEAERAFSAIVEKYPKSVKVEAATYRKSLIELEFREEELLKLLTWSHEESLRAIEDFRRKEKAYEQAIAVYQRQIADSKRGAGSDSDRELADLRGQVADLSKKLAVTEADLASSRSQLEAVRSASLEAQQAAAAEAVARVKALEADKPAAPGSAVPTQTMLSAETLAAKARALDLLSFYLTRLSPGGKK